MIDGYSEFLDLDNPSFDVAYLYFDTLDKLTLLDIDVLKLYYYTNYYLMIDNIDDYDGPTNYDEILTKYDIDYSQYEAIRENLLRLGLLENEYDNKIEKDYKNVEQAIKELRTTVSSLYEVVNGKKKVSTIKKLTSKSDVKFKAKDKLKISKFGRNFVKHFLVEINENWMWLTLSTVGVFALDKPMTIYHINKALKKHYSLEVVFFPLIASSVNLAALPKAIFSSSFLPVLISESVDCGTPVFLLIKYCVRFSNNHLILNWF